MKHRFEIRKRAGRWELSEDGIPVYGFSDPDEALMFAAGEAELFNRRGHPVQILAATAHGRETLEMPAW